MVGDPSGKSDERNLLDKETLAKNVAGIESQMRRFLDFDGPHAAIVVNNFEWIRIFRSSIFSATLQEFSGQCDAQQRLGKESTREER